MSILNFRKRAKVSKVPTRKRLGPCSGLNLAKNALEAAVWRRVVHFLRTADDEEIAHVVQKLRAAFDHPFDRDLVRANVRQVMEQF